MSKEVPHMLIHVVYNDNHFDYVKETMLDVLIKRQQVKKFRRKSGWVTIGVDPVRVKEARLPYLGFERRGRSVSPLDAIRGRVDS
jgi:hypothetical protein